MYKVFIDQRPLIFSERDDLLTYNLQCNSNQFETLEDLELLAQEATISSPLYVRTKHPKETFQKLFKSKCSNPKSRGVGC